MQERQLEQNKWIIKVIIGLRCENFFHFKLNFIKCFRSTDTEDYMQITLAAQISVGPPTPPPLPPQAPLIVTATGSKIPPPPPPQDTATRKQQQPLSAISIQDLNSVQVNLL